MTNAILRVNSDVRNPHVRFDEGEVAPEKPKRGLSLYKSEWLCFAVSLFGMASVWAGEFTLKSAPQSLADWQSGSFYDNGGNAPGAGDTVILPDNMTVKVDDDSIAFVGSFALIKPMGRRGSVLAVDIANDQDFGCAFYYEKRKDNYDTNSHGTIVKTGAGCLSLKSVASAHDYFTDMDIQAGAIRLPCKTDAGFTSVVGRVNVGPAGLLMPSANAANVTTMSQMISLSGSGIVSNGVGTAAQCRFQPWFGDRSPTEFSGKIVGNIAYFGNGFTYLTGTESTFTGEFHPYYNCESTTYGIVGVTKFGNPGEPSSIGSGAVEIGLVGGRILYLGSGETTTKNINFGDTNEGQGYATIMDAGANGGLTFTGQWTPKAYYKNQRLVLTGSNTADCVISGNIALNGTTRTYVTKKGTGTWNLADCARNGISGIAVDEGTLKFETLYEQSVASSLGDGIVKSEDSMKVVTPVAYDFRLGTATSAGTLEFAGTNRSVASSSRPMVLSGDGCLRNAAKNAAGREFGWFYNAGICALTAGDKKLTLDGANTAESVVGSISNGAGRVSVEKTGSGTWVLAGTNNTFTGEIAVKKGKLILRGVAGKFNFFRWTFRSSQSGGSALVAPILGFFDGDNHNVTQNLTLNELCKDTSCEMDKWSIPLLRPGEVSYGKSYVEFYSGQGDGGPGTRGIQLAFGDDRYGKHGWEFIDRTSGAPKPSDDNPDSWVPVVLRIAASSKPVASYDLVTLSANNVNLPKSWKMEGSVDGFTWYAIDDVTEAPSPTYEFKWVFSNGNYRNGTAATHSGGRPLAGSTNDVTVVYGNPVSVAAGAVVEADGLVQLAALKVDANGAGTVKGFSFAEKGSVDVVNYDRTTALGLTFEDCTGTENFANWSVKCDGKDRPSKSLSFKNGVLTVESSGLIMVVR